MAKIIEKVFVSMICGVCVSSGASAQSFDCSKAETYSEKTICSSPTLSAMNVQLDNVFKYAKDKAGGLDAFATIAKGNLALREQCKNAECVQNWLENSITLYEFLLNVLPTDNLAGYPKEVQDLCKNQKTTTEMLSCGDAQLNYQQSTLNERIHKILNLASSEKQKQTVQVFYDQWKKDRIKYCTLEFSGGSKDSLKISGCFLSWTRDLNRKTEDAKEFLDGLMASKIDVKGVVNNSM